MNFKMMKKNNQNLYTPSSGYMTERIRARYIDNAIDRKLLPKEAQQIADVVSLWAPKDQQLPIQFWQLYSVLGQDRIVKIVANFYRRVFADEEWFRSVFARVSGIDRHINAQAAMWIDVMGGGLAYHGGEYRLRVHHSHNAMALMNDKGAERWLVLMRQTLDDPTLDLGDDPRVRASINTFLHYFMGKYAEEFGFNSDGLFGDCNAPLTLADFAGYAETIKRTGSD